MKILIVKLGALGDVINTFPLAIHLKDKINAEITWITEPLSYPLVKKHNSVSNAVLFDKKNKLKSFGTIYKFLKSEKFDLVLDLQRILKSAFFTLNSNAQRKITFNKKRCKELTWLLNYEKIPEKDHETNHMLDQYLEFSSYLGIDPPKIINWDIPRFESTISLPEKYVVLNTGATKPANKWFEKSFSKLSDLIYQNTEFTPVLTGGPEDLDFSEKICEQCINKPLNFTGKTSLGELVEILGNAQFLISSDTGPMHLGVALGVKTAGLFGPSNPVRTGPYYGKIITKNNFSCLNCGKKYCKTRQCMDIDPEKVFKAVFLEPWQEKKAVYAF
ncbi:MAG: glycosyltransferase family 9 protein [Desulforegulaceae bacterium]|nr:glycosyltransferase family 9 protein [Desulforegulaceae bacterium]